jgi:hypothetical protein
MSTIKPSLHTSEGQRVTLEILTGRRGNRLPEIQPTQLSFSNPPTKAECDALAARLLFLERCYERLRDRMDA